VLASVAGVSMLVVARTDGSR